MSDAAPALRERAARMVERVKLEAAAVMDPTDVAIVGDAVTAALRMRDALFDDDHAPALLHPARTVLILLSDAACRDAVTLAAAAFTESLPDAPRPDPALLPPAAARLLAQVPLPSATSARDADGDDAPADALDALREELVVAPEMAALIAVAERLDHARHLHMMPGLDAAPFHAGIDRVYLPIAARICPRIARRMDRWAGAARRRRERRADAPRSGP